MSYSLTILRTAERHIDEAAVWYARRSNRAQENFLADLDDALALILRYPDAHGFFREDVRRFRLKKYPYYILYRVRGERVIVLNLFHVKRNPNNWRS